MGASFMRDWYIMHDYDDSRLGFKRLPNSGLSEPESAPIPVIAISDTSDTNIDSSNEYDGKWIQD